MSTSIIIPAKNEAAGLKEILPKLTELYSGFEIIVVDDGSEDDTGDICRQYPVRLIRHPYSKGNGASVKTGALAASGKILVFMDADGQHRPEDVEKLIDGIEQGYDMVIGQRSSFGQANLSRGIANRFYNNFASLITGQDIKDLTSGFRAVISDKFREFIHILPNGFSYPSTITMAFFRAGHSVSYVPVDVKQRMGKSHIKPFKDGARFLIIIFKIGTLYSPLKIFAPLSLFFFMTGLFHYGYMFMTQGRFTNMSALLFITSVMIFLIGLVSEQVTTLIYSGTTTGSSSRNKTD